MTGVIQKDEITLAREHQKARLYAQADRTDPFTEARCMAHHRNGIAARRHDGRGEGGYDAEAFQYMGRVQIRGRMVDVRRIGFRNLARP